MQQQGKKWWRRPITRLASLSSVFFAYYLSDNREPLDAARDCRKRKKERKIEKKKKDRDEK